MPAKRRFAGVDRHLGKFDDKQQASLYVLGVCASTFENEDAAKFYNAGRHLIRFGTTEDTTDRYDVRLIHNPPQYTGPTGELLEPGINPQELYQERFGDYFRAQQQGINQDAGQGIQQVQNQGQLEREGMAQETWEGDYQGSKSGGDERQKAQIGFDYGDAALQGQQGQQVVQQDGRGVVDGQQRDGDGGGDDGDVVKERFEPWFQVPKAIGTELPSSLKQHQIISQTASFVKESGQQLEVVLKLKHANNPNFHFLFPNSPLFGYYKWMQRDGSKIGPPPQWWLDRQQQAANEQSTRKAQSRLQQSQKSGKLDDRQGRQCDDAVAIEDTHESPTQDMDKQESNGLGGLALLRMYSANDSAYDTNYNSDISGEMPNTIEDNISVSTIQDGTAHDLPGYAIPSNTAEKYYQSSYRQYQQEQPDSTMAEQPQEGDNNETRVTMQDSTRSPPHGMAHNPPSFLLQEVSHGASQVKAHHDDSVYLEQQRGTTPLQVDEQLVSQEEPHGTQDQQHLQQVVLNEVTDQDSGGEEVVAKIIEPSSEMKAVMSKLVIFVNANGVQFQQAIKEQQNKNPIFEFLDSTSVYFPYYRNLMRDSADPLVYSDFLKHHDEEAAQKAKETSKEDDFEFQLTSTMADDSKSKAGEMKENASNTKQHISNAKQDTEVESATSPDHNTNYIADGEIEIEVGDDMKGSDKSEDSTDNPVDIAVSIEVASSTFENRDQFVAGSDLDTKDESPTEKVEPKFEGQNDSNNDKKSEIVEQQDHKITMQLESDKLQGDTQATKKRPLTFADFGDEIDFTKLQQEPAKRKKSNAVLSVPAVKYKSGVVPKKQSLLAPHLAKKLDDSKEQNNTDVGNKNDQAAQEDRVAERLARLEALIDDYDEFGRKIKRKKVEANGNTSKQNAQNSLQESTVSPDADLGPQDGKIEIVQDIVNAPLSALVPQSRSSSKSKASKSSRRSVSKPQLQASQLEFYRQIDGAVPITEFKIEASSSDSSDNDDGPHTQDAQAQGNVYQSVAGLRFVTYDDYTNPTQNAVNQTELQQGTQADAVASDSQAPTVLEEGKVIMDTTKQDDEPMALSNKLEKGKQLASSPTRSDSRESDDKKQPRARQSRSEDSRGSSSGRSHSRSRSPVHSGGRSRSRGSGTTTSASSARRSTSSSADSERQERPVQLEVDKQKQLERRLRLQQLLRLDSEGKGNASMLAPTADIKSHRAAFSMAADGGALPQSDSVGHGDQQIGDLPELPSTKLKKEKDSKEEQKDEKWETQQRLKQIRELYMQAQMQEEAPLEGTGQDRIKQRLAAMLEKQGQVANEDDEPPAQESKQVDKSSQQGQKGQLDIHQLRKLFDAQDYSAAQGLGGEDGELEEGEIGLGGKVIGSTEQDGDSSFKLPDLASLVKQGRDAAASNRIKFELAIKSVGVMESEQLDLPFEEQDHRKDIVVKREHKSKKAKRSDDRRAKEQGRKKHHKDKDKDSKRVKDRSRDKGGGYSNDDSLDQVKRRLSKSSDKQKYKQRKMHKGYSDLDERDHSIVSREEWQADRKLSRKDSKKKEQRKQHKSSKLEKSKGVIKHKDKKRRKSSRSKIQSQRQGKLVESDDSKSGTTHTTSPPRRYSSSEEDVDNKATGPPKVEVSGRIAERLKQLLSGSRH